MSPDTSIRGSAPHVALVVLFAVVVTVAGIAPAVAGSPTAGSVYQISDLNVPASITNGESYTVSAQLSNPGSTDMQVVAFRIDTNGDGEFTPNESLGAEAFVLLGGDARNVTFDVTVPEDLAPGEYEYMLRTESSNTTGTVSVESPIAPATFLLAGASAPESVAAGDSFVVSADVANVGDLNGTETMSLYLDTNGDGMLSDEVALANTTFELASASNGTVNLTATAPDLEPGNYTIGVGTSTEMVTENLAIEEPPAPFDVVSLRADRAMVGGTVSVSTIVENTGDEERTGTVELRLDTNGDGEFSASETVRTREVSLGPGSSQQHGFAVTLPDSYTPGEYELALVTPTTERVTSFEVFRPTSSSPSSESDGESDETTREDISQALYGQSYDSLTIDQAWQVEDVYDRMPLPSDTSLSDLETIEQISQRLYEKPFTVDSAYLSDRDQYTLTTAEAINVRNTYDRQFGPLPTNPEYSLDEIARGIYQQSFADLSDSDPWQAVKIQMVYNRQPFVDSVGIKGVDTLRWKLIENMRDEDRNEYIWYWQNFGSEPGLTLEDVLKAQQEYEDQFKES